MIRFHDRTLILGYTRSGKSELLNHHFSAIRCQRVLVDTKEEWRIAGVEPVQDVEAIDWRAPVIHLVAEPGDLESFDRFFRVAFERKGPLVVCVHELADVCDYKPNATPRWVRRYFSQGAAHGLGLLGASQRPVEMPRRGRTEADHVFAVVPRMDQEDVDVIARMMHVSPAQLERELEDLHSNWGGHSFLWFDRRDRRLQGFEPLPDRVRSGSVVQRRPGVA